MVLDDDLCLAAMRALPLLAAKPSQTSKARMERSSMANSSLNTPSSAVIALGLDIPSWSLSMHLPKNNLRRRHRAAVSEGIIFQSTVFKAGLEGSSLVREPPCPIW